MNLNLNKIAVLALIATVLMVQSSTAEDKNVIPIESVLVTTLEKADVPAQEAGVLIALKVREGDMVTAGQPLALMNDKIAKLQRDRAAVELKLARAHAENDVKFRYAEKALAVTRAELQRAQDSVNKFRKAISQTEMDRLKLTMEKSALEVEQAQRDQLEARLESEVKEHEAQLAEEIVRRRTIVAPISGVVVQVSRSQGEWVQPGDAILRIVRIDRLRAEGFADARLVNRSLAGHSVVLTLQESGQQPQTFSGKLIFVSPEVNRFNGQVRIWATIDNPRHQLRPGRSASMTVSTNPPTESHTSANK